MRTRLAICAALALLVTGCSSDDEPDSTTAESGDTPSCAEVWVDGQTLPEDYDGCENEDGSTEALVTIECASGDLFTSYQDEFYAVLGGEITEAPSDSEEYADAYAECAG